MGRPYSEDLRVRIVAAVAAGASCSAAARQFGVSCGIKLLQRWRRTGSVAPTARGKKPYALADDEVLVRELVAACPDVTLDELHAELGRRGIQVGRSSIGRFLLACGLTLKKSRFMPPSSNGRMSRLHARFGARARLA